MVSMKCSKQISDLSETNPTQPSAEKNHMSAEFCKYLCNSSGWFTHLEKYESMGRTIPYMKWKIKFMFETTNQMGYGRYKHS